MTTFIFKVETMYGAYALERHVTAYGSFLEEALNNLTAQMHRLKTGKHSAWTFTVNTPPMRADYEAWLQFHAEARILVTDSL